MALGSAGQGTERERPDRSWEAPLGHAPRDAALRERVAAATGPDRRHGSQPTYQTKAAQTPSTSKSRSPRPPARESLPADSAHRRRRLRLDSASV